MTRNNKINCFAVSSVDCDDEGMPNFDILKKKIRQKCIRPSGGRPAAALREQKFPRHFLELPTQDVCRSFEKGIEGDGSLEKNNFYVKNCGWAKS